MVLKIMVLKTGDENMQKMANNRSTVMQNDAKGGLIEVNCSNTSERNRSRSFW